MADSKASLAAPEAPPKASAHDPKDEPKTPYPAPVVLVWLKAERGLFPKHWDGEPKFERRKIPAGEFFRDTEDMAEHFVAAKAARMVTPVEARTAQAALDGAKS